MKIGRYKTLMSKLLALIVFMFSPVSYAGSMQNILVLHSYDAAYGWTIDLQQGIEDAIGSSSQSLKLSVEYLDTKRINSVQYYVELSKYFKHKYGSYNFDGVIITDDNALSFFNSLEMNNLKQLPTIAVGINNIDSGLYSSTNKGTVIYETDYIADNLRLIKQLRPKLKNLYLLSDYGVTSKITRKKILGELMKHANLNLVEIRNQSLLQATKTLSQISEDDAVFLTHFNTEINAGVFHGYDEVARVLSEQSAAPVFVLWEFYIQGDVLGGYVNRSYKMGVQAVELLGAKLPDPIQINIEIQKDTAAVFNYGALNKYDIPESALPTNAIIIGKPISFIEKNFLILAVTGSIILMLILVILVLFILLKRKREINRQKQKIMKLQKQGLQDQKNMIHMLGDAIETRSGETGNHVKRVAKISAKLGMYAGLTETEQVIIENISPMHDVGKIGIPEAILNKPGKLSTEEWALMQTHTKIGYKLLSSSGREMMDLAATVALEHHEYWNGKGYPHGKSGTSIHIFSRITAIADVFDALLSRRCYKDPWTITEVLPYFKEKSGEQFDPQLTELFLENINEFIQIRDKYPDGDFY